MHTHSDVLSLCILRFVATADAAFTDSSAPVLVEEVVSWLGPCVSGASTAADPVGLPEGLPFRWVVDFVWV